jgi:hypothetical protein
MQSLTRTVTTTQIESTKDDGRKTLNSVILKSRYPLQVPVGLLL